MLAAFSSQKSTVLQQKIFFFEFVVKSSLCGVNFVMEHELLVFWATYLSKMDIVLGLFAF
jgi:hypothetical protein